MNTDPNWKDLLRAFRVFTIWAASSLIDSAFLALWVFVQWFINSNVVMRFRLSGIDQWMLSAFQLLFAISTLAPVIFYIGADTMVMFLQARRRIRRELDKDKKNDPSKRR